MDAPSSLLDAHDQPALAQALHRLRIQCGNPSLTILAKRTRIPRSTLHDYLRGGGSLLPLDRLRLLVAAISPDSDLKPWEAAWRRITSTRHTGAVEPGGGARPVPRGLPVAPFPFVGRSALLARLDEPFERPEPGRPALSVLTGGGGVGKTATAVHWAHGRAERFGDGQLYVDLAGFGTGEPRSPAAVLRYFLCCLGDSPGTIPAGLDERVTRFRNLTHRLRLLLVCDNAASTEQLEPLLPNGSDCYVLVTTRHDFHGFSARHGARRTVVPPLSGGEATDLAARLLGETARAEPEAVAEFADRCARLPLAIRLAAERFADTGTDGLAKRVAAVSDALRADPSDDRVDLTAIFDQTLSVLDDGARRLFTAVGLHPGRRFQLRELAALSGLDGADLDRHFDALVRAHLVEETEPDVYSAHDLLRSHAAARARDLPDTVATAARNRLAEYFVHSLTRAKDTEHPWDAPRQPRRLPGSGRGALEFGDVAEAAAWIRYALPNLAASVTEWAKRGMTNHIGWVSAALWLWLNLHCRFDEAKHIHGAFVSAAEATGDDMLIGTAAFRLGDVHWRIGDHETAEQWFQRARDHKRRAGHPAGVVHCLSGLGTVLMITDRLGEATEVFDESRRLAESLGDDESAAIARCNLGEVGLRGQDWAGAEHWLERAAELAERIDARHTLVSARVGLAQVYARQGRHAESDRLIELARSAATDLESAELLAEISYGIGMAYLARGRPEAVGHLRQALRQFQRLGLTPYAAWAGQALAETGQR